MDKRGWERAASLVGEVPTSSVLGSPPAAFDASSEAMLVLEGEVGAAVMDAVGISMVRSVMAGSPDGGMIPCSL